MRRQVQKECLDCKEQFIGNAQALYCYTCKDQRTKVRHFEYARKAWAKKKAEKYAA